jgi:hypothetical protein
MPLLLPHVIASITPLAKDHPVVKVTLVNGFAFVVKAETSRHDSQLPGLSMGIVKPDPVKGTAGKDLRPFNKASAEVSSSLMSLVSPGTQSVPLNTAETAAIMGWRSLPMTLSQMAQQISGRAAFLVKMPFLKGVTSTEAMKDKVFDPANKPAMAKMAAELEGNTPVWKGLGKIILVDAFVGNGDRIDFSGNRIQNISNLIFQTDAQGEIVKAVGLDVFDPYAADAGRMHGTMIDAWITDFGQYIKDQFRYMALASSIVNDLSTRWFKGAAGVDTSLGGGEAAALGVGMSQAYAELSRKLSGDAKMGRRMPSGVMARAVYLGWVQ